jgi:hypothetical protein
MEINSEVTKLRNEVNRDIIERFRDSFRVAQEDPSDIGSETEETVKVFAVAFPYLVRAFDMVVIEELHEQWGVYCIQYEDRITGFEEFLNSSY